MSTQLYCFSESTFYWSGGQKKFFILHATRWQCYKGRWFTSEGSLEKVAHIHIPSVVMHIYSYLIYNHLSLVKTQRLPIQVLSSSLTSSLNLICIILHYNSYRIQLTRLSKESLFKWIDPIIYVSVSHSVILLIWTVTAHLHLKH